jgi:hypothetical protein
VRTASLALVASIALLGLALAQGSAQGEKDAKAKVNRYIGADKCKNCHQSEEKGNQYGVWMKSKHASAFVNLAGDDAKKLAQAKGIEDPQKSDACIKCHVTAFGQPEDHIKKGFDPKAGVQCEICHGPGEQHVKLRMAAAATADPANKEPQALEPGEIRTNIDEKTCAACHNAESPSFKPFCFHKRTAEIRHYDPRKKARAALPPCSCPDCIKGCDPAKCGVPAKQ